MIIFLYGQDTYRIRQKLQEIIEHYKKTHKSGLNLRFFDSEESKKLDFQDFRREFQTISMFQEKKMVILRDVFQNAEFKKAFLENSQKFVDPKDIVIFQEEREISPKDKDPLFEFLIQNAKSQEFGPLQDRQLKNWAKKELARHQFQAEPQTLTMLANYIGNDLWQFSNEIKKMVAFKKNGTIESKDVALLVKPKIEADIFKTIDALASKNKKQALSLIHKHLERGDNPLYLLSMINFQFRNLLMVKTSKNPRLHPYVIKKSLWQARWFSLEELKKIYRRLFEIDLAVKTGRLNSETALDLLITEI